MDGIIIGILASTNNQKMEKKWIDFDLCTFQVECFYFRHKQPALQETDT